MTRKKLFLSLSFVLALALGSALPADAKVLKKGDCADVMCNLSLHPRPRVLKPVACIPLRFDQWKPGAVTLRIDYADGRPSKYDSKPAGTNGQYCRGESVWRGGTVCLCNNDNGFATLNADEVAAGLERARTGKGRFGWSVSLKGLAWGTSHGARAETVPCQALPKQ
ncbi:hypothetical protein K8R03_02550 [Candidatus Kaiserbacteria bacterium]|nr:hypothetical protein [Candidatus Kaiserbacteria bacterium]